MRPRPASSPEFPEGSSFSVKSIRAFSAFVLALNLPVRAAVLLDERFDDGIPGWTSVQPPGVYRDGPLRWEYDFGARAFVERSNVHTDSGDGSPTAIAPMIVNGALAEAPYTFRARLTAGDDDGFGLVFGYRNESNFYRVAFARQARTIFPRRGWAVDRKTNGATTVLFNSATSFIPAAGVAFDVTLSVDAAKRLTLQVVEDPDGAATVRRLVDGKTLPTAADGQVGLFTWGMGGGDPPGFLIQNLELVPGGLQGDLERLRAWESILPPRGNGSTALTGGVGRAQWFVKALQHGQRGSLEENSDSGAGLDVAGRVDFTGPTLVAGDSAWSNVVVAARIIPDDILGFGFLLRCRSPSNFYRVALRASTSSGAGIRSGLSVQKNVEGIYSEVYRDNPALFNPSRKVPLDLVAEIRSNVLNVLAVSDPDGEAEVHRWGPISIAGQDRGKVGVFSWFMYKLEYDWIRVCAGAPLYVSSPHGSPSPGRGLGDHEIGERVEAFAGEDVSEPGVRRTAIGWTGAGSVPSIGTGNAVSFVLDSFSQLHWQWQTEYRLIVSNDPGGVVSGPSAEWLLEGTSITVVAQADPGYVFVGWSGDRQSQSPTLAFAMDRPCRLTAHFLVDEDGDGEADDWERAYWGNSNVWRPGGPNWEGWPDRPGLAVPPEPNPTSRLYFEGLEEEGGGAPGLRVANRTGSRYAVEWCTNLSAGWSLVSTNVQADEFVLPATTNTQTFWRLRQPGRPVHVPKYVPGSWTLVVLPDTQFYSESHPDLFLDQTRWILANKDRYDVRFVLHVGDLVNGDVAGQWSQASNALALLDGQIPYAVVPGNHDYSEFYPARTTCLNAYFPPSRFSGTSSFGGVKDAGRMENSYHLFSAGGVDWLVLALEFGPRNATLAWADSIVGQYPGGRVIYLTHAYLYDDDTRYNWAAKGVAQSRNPHFYSADWDPDGTNDGEELWQKLVRRHASSTLVIGGHVTNDGQGRLASRNDAGGAVHQLAVNYQTGNLGGEGYLRLLEFRPDGKTVQIKTYSPYLGTYLVDPQNQYELELDPPLPRDPRSAAP